MKVLLSCALAFLLFQSVHATTYTLHTVQAGDAQGSVRITNLSDNAGAVEITGFDENGDEYDPVELNLDARQTVTLSGTELENGAQDKGLYSGLGDGAGIWQLELDADFSIGGLSYVSREGATIVLAEIDNPDPLDHFLRAHQLADQIKHSGVHERLSAYDWIPHRPLKGVDLGWGDHETNDGALWTRYGGHLRYSAF